MVDGGRLPKVDRRNMEPAGGKPQCHFYETTIKKFTKDKESDKNLG